MVAEIVCVGTELLLGDIVNTNAQHISKELAHIGIDLYYQTVVGDNKERVWKCIRHSFEAFRPNYHDRWTWSDER